MYEIDIDNTLLSEMLQKYDIVCTQFQKQKILYLALLKFYFPKIKYNKLISLLISLYSPFDYKNMTTESSISRYVFQLQHENVISKIKLRKFIDIYFSNKCIHLNTFTISDIFNRIIKLGYILQISLLREELKNYFKNSPYFFFEKENDSFIIYTKCGNCNVDYTQVHYSKYRIIHGNKCITNSVCVNCQLKYDQDFYFLDKNKNIDLFLEAHHKLTYTLLHYLGIYENTTIYDENHIVLKDKKNIHENDISYSLIYSTTNEWYHIKEPEQFYTLLKAFMQCTNENKPFCKENFNATEYDIKLFQYLYADLRQIYDRNNDDSIQIQLQNKFGILL
ncbi:MAG: hypothetical protein WC934_06300 [Acidithiobacillus sp.]|jgi:hypothetical protein